jgi:ligand-binding SRPBCC domain-containing protein
VAAPVESISEFHRDTRVLKHLTPFPVIVQFKHVERVSEGSKADFNLWFGPVPVNWVAMHHDVDPRKGFTDTQADGPFSYWVHHHSFIKINDQTTAVRDEITARFGKGLIKEVISRAIWFNLPLLFKYRAWKTKRIIGKNRNGKFEKIETNSNI